MNIEDKKLELIQLLLETYDKDILEKVEDIFKNNQERWLSLNKKNSESTTYTTNTEKNLVHPIMQKFSL